MTLNNIVIEANELISLFIDLASLPIVYMVFHNKDIPRYYLFIVALVCLIASHFFTIAEGFAFNHLFNLIEHFTLTLASFFFLVGLLIYFIGKSKK